MLGRLKNLGKKWWWYELGSGGGMEKRDGFRWYGGIFSDFCDCRGRVVKWWEV